MYMLMRVEPERTLEVVQSNNPDGYIIKVLADKVKSGEPLDLQ